MLIFYYAGVFMYLVTGAGSGIGRALSHRLAARGHSVLAVGRREAHLLETASYSSRIQVCCADVSKADGREKIMKALQGVRSISGLIHNAGTLQPVARLKSLDEAAWQQAFDTNLNAPLFLTQVIMQSKSLERVLHIGSGAAYFPVKGWAAYCVSKVALAMLTRCWQEETEGVPVFASVMPGIVNTHMQEMARHGACMAPEKLAFYEKLYRENRLISPETVAQFLSWLLIDIPEARYCEQEWDIYDTTHHSEWLIPPHTVPPINE